VPEGSQPGITGKRGKIELMKNRRTNLEAVPVSPKPDDVDPMNRTLAPRKPDARLGREVQARIGQQLRAMYNDVVNQGVPDHIADLVRRLSDQEHD